jgi:carbon monoxide dehydrogenase subunit G
VHFSERLIVPVPLPQAWEFIWRAERLAGCLPGCTGVDEIDPGRQYRAHFADHVGPYRVQFDLDVEILRTEPQRLVELQASGNDKRLGMTQRIRLTVELTATSADATALAVEAEVEVLGRIAALGQFVVKRKAQEVVQGLARNIEAALDPSSVGDSHA